ncbi:MAG: hypothetical protein ABS78_06815 [Phenylobacterium sp. SCN 70-31]|nr:MAG: hypothetical protein ABS78_06815 [Phenylobacterium sp. SCN 70-31]
MTPMSLANPDRAQRVDDVGDQLKTEPHAFVAVIGRKTPHELRKLTRLERRSMLHRLWGL